MGDENGIGSEIVLADECMGLGTTTEGSSREERGEVTKEGQQTLLLTSCPCHPCMHMLLDRKGCVVSEHLQEL